jgi:hypothetical protein
MVPSGGVEAAGTSSTRVLRAPVAPGAAARADAARDGRLAQIALVLIVGYAIFQNGASGSSALAWTTALVCILGLTVLARCLRPQAAVPRMASGTRVAIGMLALFAAWSGLSVLWSVDPAGTWEELNRAILYVLVVGLAVTSASLSGERGVERASMALLGLTTVIGLYALGGKVIPGFSPLGLFDLNHTRDLARLRGPLGYWNALALVLVTGIPFALRVSTDRTRTDRVRLLGLAAAFVLVTALFMTYSRGGFLALFAALAVLTAFGAARLRTYVALAAVTACALPGVLYTFGQARLVANGVPLDDRIAAGRTLGVFVVFGLIALMVVGWGLLRLEPRVRWSAARTRKLFRGLALTVLAVGLISLAGAATGEGGLRGAVDRATSSFTDRQQDDQFDPARVLTTNSGNRWIWWGEAAGAFSDRPIGGWGAGSFSVVHKLYRTDQLAVRQPHSVPLQFLSETGMIGGFLALGGLATLLGIGILRVRSMSPGRSRDLGVGLLAAGVAWIVHGIFDWDWSLPGATLPAMLAFGALAALPARAQPPRERSVAAVGGGAAEPVRWGLAALATLVAVAATASAVLPARAETVTGEAESIAGDATTEEERREAAARAELAARLDPLSPAPLFVAASIAQGRGRLLEAREHLLEAVDRQPYSAEAWLRLSQIALALADFKGFADAAQRVLENDPSAGTSQGLVRRVQVALTPPAASATATGTPLPAAGAVAPGPAPAPAPGTPAPGLPSPDPGAAPGSSLTPGATPGSGLTPLPGPPSGAVAPPGTTIAPGTQAPAPTTP